MKESIILLILLFNTTISEAQFIKDKSINAQVGYGLSAPNNSVDGVVDDGFFAQGEFVMKVASWFEIRPYVGFIFTSSGGKDTDNNPTNEKAESKALLIGGKSRFRAPIPWIAPYVEVGIGTSIGNFVTNTPFDNIDKSGIIYHIPFSVGLELGKNNNVDLGLIYYLQPSVEQYVGGVAIGITFPLNN